MSGRISIPISSIAIVAGLLAAGIAVGLRANSARADDCLVEPNAPAPEGSHWYYHMDRTKQRKCWYLRAPDQPAQQVAAHAVSDAAPDAHTTPLVQATTASAVAPIPISPNDIHQSSPHIKMLATKPQRGDSTTTDESVQNNVEEEATVSSIATAPTSQASAMPQIGALAEPASAADTAWPTLSVTAIKMQQPTSTDAQQPTSTKAPTESVQSTADASIPDEAESTAQDDVSATHAVTASLIPSTPAEMFPIFALGLVIAGFLFRVAVKIAAACSRRRINVDRHIIPTVTDDSSPLAFQHIDERPDDAGGKDCAFDITDEIRKRVEVLDELRRDLDRLLRSPKVASPQG